MERGDLKGMSILGRFAYDISVGATSVEENSYHIKLGGQLSIVKTMN